MSELNLNDQNLESTSIRPKLLRLKYLMDLRLPIWLKMPYSKKRIWITSNKDPVMDIAWDVYKYLHSFFGGVDPDGNT